MLFLTVFQNTWRIKDNHEYGGMHMYDMFFAEVEKLQNATKSEEE